MDTIIEENDNLRETIAEVEQKLQTAVSENNTSADEMRKFLEKMAELESNLERCQIDKNKLSSLEREHENALADLQLKNMDYVKLSKVVNDYEKIIKNLEENLQVSLSDKDQMTIVLNDCLAKIIKLEAIAQKYKEGSNTISALKAAYEQAQAELQRKTLECYELSNCEQDHKRTIHKLKSVNGQLQKSLKVLQKNHEEKSDELNSSFTKRAELEATIQTYKESFDKTSVLEAAYKHAQAELNKKILEFNNLSICADDYKRTINTINRTNEDLEKSLRSIKKQLEEYQNKSSNRNCNELDALKNNLLEMGVILKNSEDELRSRDAEVKRLRFELERDNGVKNQLFKNNNELHVHLEELKNENLGYSSRIAEIQQKYEKVSSN